MEKLSLELQGVENFVELNVFHPTFQVKAPALEKLCSTWQATLSLTNKFNTFSR
jgi:hypothetical protein